jgi:hypothetical protein
MNGQNNLIQSNDKFTAILGIDNIVVINTPDATLVVPRAKVENVKDLVSFLIENGYKDLV